MKKSFRKKLIDNGFSQDQAEKIEKLVLEETEQAKVSGGNGPDVNQCPYCGSWFYGDDAWNDHYENCPARPSNNNNQNNHNNNHNNHTSHK